MAWFVIMGAFYLFLPKQIFGIFTTDQSVLEMAPLYCKIAIINLLGSCTMTGQFSLVRGIGFASFDLIVGILDGVVARIGLSVLFGSIMGLSGYWFGTSLAGYVTTILMGIYYLSGRWEKRSSVTK
jgi:Na+-driven multidrug efflux pump